MLRATPRLALLAATVAGALFAAACTGDGENRPQVDVIGGNGTASAGQTGSVSASGAGPSAGGSSAPAPASGGVLIPVGLAPVTSGPTKSDGIYTPTTNREIYQKIATDYQEIVALTNQVNEGKPLPAAEILLLYEAGKHTRIGTSSRSLRMWAREAARTADFPDAVAFYNAATFLDTPVNDAIVKARTAENYTDAQRRQAIQKGIQRILYHWSRHYVQRACPALNPGLVDEAWAIYVGEEKDGKYPHSLAATAQSREANFNRPDSVDRPLREAMSRMQKAANDKNQAECEAAANDVYSRLNAIFYLGSARYLNEALKSAQAGNAEAAGVAQVEGLSFYQSIQPEVARADPAADKALVDYYQAAPASLTPASRDAALEALNRTATALRLTPGDLVTSFQ
jgi:hypothetical protein